MRLFLLPRRFAISRLEPGAGVPAWPSGAFVSVTRTASELSVVCEEGSVPEGVRCDRGWRCLEAEGPIPFETTGIAASLASPLAQAGVSVFLIATFDTDYLLVKESSVAVARDALSAAGHEVVEAPLTPV